MSLIRGTTRDYIMCAVRDYGPLIFVIDTLTGYPEKLAAIDPSIVMTAEFARQFNMCLSKILIAWERLPLIPVLSETGDIEFLAWSEPIIQHNTSELYVLK